MATQAQGSSPSEFLEVVRDAYTEAARSVEQGGESLSTGTAFYRDEVLRNLPRELTTSALGCTDLVPLADLEPGQTVVDLGCGGGLDAVLAALAVGPSGRIVGVDATPAMVQLAQRNAARAGVENVCFVQGLMESVPLRDSCADVVIANCSVNLAANKADVFREMRRVVRPDGRVAIADLASFATLEPEIERAINGWSGCAAGMLSLESYERGLLGAGFGRVTTRVLRAITRDDLSREDQPPPTTNGIESWSIATLLAGSDRFGSALICAHGT